MTKRNLGFLLVAVILLGGLFWLSEPKFQATTAKSASRLFDSLDPGRIAKIELQNGDKSIELLRKDGVWTVPARGGFPANSGKLRSLLLKVLDLSASQAVPTSKEGIEKLGLTDQGVVEKSYGKVAFFGESGEKLGGLYLGEARQKKPSGPSSPQLTVAGSGQYVRPLEVEQVYLVSLPVTVNAEIGYWLESSLLNILGSRVVSAVAYDTSGEQEKKLYELESVESDAAAADAGERKLTLAGEIPADSEIEESVLAQVKSGLENLSLEDVFPAAADEVKGLKFDRKIVYRIDNGLEYTVESASRESKDAAQSTAPVANDIFGKISVSFSDDLAAKLKSEAEAAWAKKQEQKKKDEEAAKQAAAEATPSDAQAEPTPAPTPVEEKMPELKLSSADEAKKLNEEFKPWVYKFPSYQGSKFRRSREELTKKKEEKKEAPAAEPAAAPPAGG